MVLYSKYQLLNISDYNELPDLPKEVQFAEPVYEFKKLVKTRCRKYENLLIS